ncbi:MAG: signal peptidase II [Arcanobacterium sp.]|nr:signal peptidase II [Arcanobacterium sp.]
MQHSKKTWVIAIVLLLLLTAIDQATKQWAISALANGQQIPLLGEFLSLRLIFNSGAAFSLGDSFTWIFTIFAAAIVIGMPLVIARFKEQRYLYVLTVIWSGALGNLIDRLFREPGFGTGHVVDFINYNNWFIGNVADIALVLGVAVLIGMQFWDEYQEKKGTESLNV